MRWIHVLASLSVFSAAVLASEEPAVAEPAEAVIPSTGEPEVVATAEWPETNPDQNVINGERNALTVNIENKSDRNVTLLAIGGSLSHPDTGAVIKNLSTATFNFQLINGLKMQMPYAFFSEHKPGDMRLNIWLEHVTDDEKYRVTAFDNVVAVVEPPKSIFDFQLVTTYLTVLAMAGAFGYFTYDNLSPKPKKGRKAKTETVSEPTATTTATSTGAYDDEWIPEHHKKGGAKKGGKVNQTSGDELSGGETSGAEGLKKRKNRK